MMKSPTRYSVAKHWLLGLILLIGSIAQAQPTILPTQWVRQITGPDQQRIWALAVDGSSNVLVAGDFLGPSVFGPGVSLTNTGPGVPTDFMFLAKYTAQGNLLWVQQPTGSANAKKIVTDAVGNTYVMGLFFGTITMGSLSLTVPGVGQSGQASAYFLAKFNSQGTPLWLQLMPPAVEMKDLVLAGCSRLCMVGSRNPEGAFVVCYDSQGNQQWLQHGTSSPDPVAGAGSLGFSLAATAGGRIMVGGAYGGNYQLGGTALPAGATGFIAQGLYGYLGNSFLAQLDTLGNIGWARYAPVNGFVNGRHMALAIGPNDATYVTDNLVVPASFGGGAVTLTAAPAPTAGSSIYFVAYDAQGTPMWVNTASTTVLDAYYQLFVNTIAVDLAGRIYLGGTFSNAVNFGPYSVAVTGIAPRTDLFVASYDALGRIQSLQRDGGPQTDDACSAMALNRMTGTLYMASNSSTFPLNGPTDFGGTTFTIGGVTDAFLVALNAAAPLASRTAANAAALAVAPNPASAGTPLHVTLAAPATELRLLNAVGQVVRRQPAAAGGSRRHQCHRSGRRPGGGRLFAASPRHQWPDDPTRAD